MAAETEHQRKHEAIRAEFPDLVTKPFECDVGWFPILEAIFGTVRQAIPAGREGDFMLLQVKEKLGGLRVYYRLSKRVTASAEAQIHAACSAAEASAAISCEVCGRPGVLRVQDGGWLITRCDKHADGGVPVPPADEGSE
ncbi:hypothetical protein EN850_02855 [Mesorhizobium sp. M8A.F.Ca.ET.207.01.1.1]|uniref:hypothetical protein n=1 Tax=Mesorhizobium sp. M8A.F.Ca.ET.207.01.1.1 TaxID=2563968 RepID=UPI00109C719E|nr:hypothetical protein [Mesorhizobium sp. M8A.F.Ca.ET.207.01.1.1]TGQ83699.1 hypothetical protein EN850_02855 [Mesorhizobium sp. M8A.F.Ca.ET.207.01.1.1]